MAILVSDCVHIASVGAAQVSVEALVAHVARKEVIICLTAQQSPSFTDI